MFGSVRVKCCLSIAVVLAAAPTVAGAIEEIVVTTQKRGAELAGRAAGDLGFRREADPEEANSPGFRQPGHHLHRD